jgi:hypothetical protein
MGEEKCINSVKQIKKNCMKNLNFEHRIEHKKIEGLNIELF